MKNLFLIILCACASFAIMAGVLRPDAAQSMQASKKSSVASQNANGKKAGQSLHQFLQERNLTLNDNRLTKKAPRRDSADGLAGTKIAVTTAQALDHINDTGDPILSDTVYNLGWNTEVYYYGADDTSDWYYIDNFYGKYQVPYNVDHETGEAALFSCWLDYDSISKISGHRRNDTITTTYLFTVNDFFYYAYAGGEALYGDIFSDGSISFNGDFLIYTEVVANYYNGDNLMLSDTLGYVSPVMSGLDLLQPNGIHECEVQQVDSSSSGNYKYDVDATTSMSQSLIWDSGDVGPGGKRICICGGSGGLHPKPIGPRPPVPVVPRPPVHIGPIHNQPQGDFGGAGDGSGQVKYSLLNGFNSKTGDGDSCTMQTPVYMFQYDDSTLFVCNLFGLGSTMKGMFIHQDGSVTLPGQALFYDEVLDEDFYNFSLEGDSLILGSTGIVTPETISWDNTVPHGLYHASSCNFNNNRLYFIDGTQFYVPGSFARGDVNKDGDVDITDVTALISILLNGDCDNLGVFGWAVIDCNQDYAISITDVAALINYLLSGVWPD